MKRKITIVLLVAVIASANDRPSMKCRVVVPGKYKQAPLNPRPNGQPEPVRYTVSYEAFWWNCVAVRAADLQVRCPSQSSGTPAATAGASDGATNADMQIDNLLRKYEKASVQDYLLSIAKQKIRPYFEKPTPEKVH